MASGFRTSAGVDFDTYFAPYVIGTKPADTGFRTSDGVDIANRYAPIVYGSKAADCGFRTSGGLDVTNLFAAAGTAVYVQRGGVPSTIEINAVTGPGGGSALVRLTHSRNGVVAWIGDNAGSGAWSPGGGTPGDNYDVVYTLVGSSGGSGTLTGATGTRQQINADRSVQLQVNLVSGSIISIRTINVQLVDRSNNNVLVNYNVDLYVAISTDG